MMEKVVAVLLKSKELFFKYLQEILIYFLFVIAGLSLFLAFSEFQTSLYGVLCLAIGGGAIFLAIHLSELKGSRIRNVMWDFSKMSNLNNDEIILFFTNKKIPV